MVLLTKAQLQQSHANCTREELIEELFKIQFIEESLQQTNIEKNSNIEILRATIAILENRIVSLTDEIQMLQGHNPDAVTPRMLAWQNPYMIEEHTKKKNNASESTSIIQQ